MIVWNQTGTAIVNLEMFKDFRIEESGFNNEAYFLFAESHKLGEVSTKAEAKKVLERIAFAYRVNEKECDPWSD